MLVPLSVPYHSPPNIQGSKSLPYDTEKVSRLLVALAFSSLAGLSFSNKKDHGDPLTVTLIWLFCLCVFVASTSIAILHVCLNSLRLGVQVIQLDSDTPSYRLDCTRWVLYTPHIWTASAALFLALSWCSMAYRVSLVELQPTPSQVFYICINALGASAVCITWTILALRRLGSVTLERADNAGCDASSKA